MESKIGDTTLYVKKITSLHPTEFKFVSLQWAFDKYLMYLFTIHDTPYKETNGAKVYKQTRADSAKSFKEWCRTEI